MSTKAVSALIAALLAPSTAWAGANDIVLHRFRTCPSFLDVDEAARCEYGISREHLPGTTDPNRIARVWPDTDSFAKLVRELGMVVSPRPLAPAETLGEAGFAFGVGTSVMDIRQDADYWRRATPEEGKTAADLLTTLHLQLRKGLPFSFETGGTLSYLVGSEMFMLGAELKWAVNEGFVLLPDIAVRGTINALLGNRDLDMITGGADVTISHPFPIGGMVTLTPYAGWNRLVISAASHVIDATPALSGFPPPHCDVDAADPVDRERDSNGTVTEECARAVEGDVTEDELANFVLARQTMQVNRWFGGLRVQFAVVTLTLEGGYGEELASGSAKAELHF